MPADSTVTESTFTSALAQLLANPVLRDTFVANPDTAADLLQIAPADRPLFVSLPATQIKRQAQLLITKRMRATFEQLPITVKYLGAESSLYFCDYATRYWPDTYRRHKEDALRFCQFLVGQKLPINQSEYNRVRFHCSGSRWRVYLAKDVMINGQSHLALQILLHIKGRHNELRIYFKI